MSTRIAAIKMSGKVIGRTRKLKSETDAVASKTKKSLNYYKWEAASQGDEAATGYYSASYISMYGGSAGLGILGSVIHLFSGLLYIKLPAAASALGSRKRAVIIIGFLDALTWLPLILAFLFFRSLPLPFFISLWVISIVPAVVITPILFSWVSDMIPVNRRGRYFGMRSIIGGAAYIAIFYAMGSLLNLFDRRVEIGFAIVFFIAFAGQIISWLIYQRMYEPKQIEKTNDCFGFTDFIKAARHSNLGKFIIYISLLNLAIYLALPFLAVYILEDLGYSYAFFTILMLSQTTGKLLSLGLWGKLSDMKGNLQLIAVASILTPLVPILWIISNDIVFLTFAMLFSGIVWAGLELCAPNFVYEAAAEGRGMKYVSYYKGLSSIAMAIGMLVGGYLATHVFTIMNYKILTLFLVSGLVSMIVVVSLLPRLSEVRPLAHWRHKTSKSKWGLTHKFGQRKNVIPSYQYRPGTEVAGCTQASAASDDKGGETMVCKGLYYDDSHNTYWGRPVVNNGKKYAINTGNAIKFSSATQFGKPIVDNSNNKNKVERKGLYYRKNDWAYYWSRTLSCGPELGIGADKI